MSINTSADKTRSSGLVFAAFLSFFIFGFSDVIKGTAIPEILKTTAVGYNTGGALIGFTYFGFFAGTLGSVYLLKKFSVPGLLAAAVITACAGMAMFSIPGNVALMFAAAFLIGAGGGLIDVTANLTVRMTADGNKIGARLNQLAFFHGGGAILSPFFSGLVLSLTTSWRFIYLYAAIFCSLLAAVIIFLTGRKRKAEETENRTFAKLKVGPQVVLLGIILFFYMTLEAGISGWIVEYGRAVSGLNEASSLFYLSLFFILLTAGRFLSSFYVDKFGLNRSIMFNFVMVLLLVAGGTMYRNLTILIPVSGLFMAPIFPTTVALISNQLKSSNIRIMGIFFSIAGIGGVFGPWMIGLLAKGFSLQTGFALLMIFAICGLTVCALFICVGGKDS